jgi:uncharacterized protein YbdZ (MbtH family)
MARRLVEFGLFQVFEESDGGPCAIWPIDELEPIGWDEVGEVGTLEACKSQLVERVRAHEPFSSERGRWIVMTDGLGGYGVVPDSSMQSRSSDWQPAGCDGSLDRCLEYAFERSMECKEREEREREAAQAAEAEAKRKAWEALTDEQRRAETERQQREAAAREAELQRAIERERNRVYLVAIDAEERHAVFPADEALPPGWHAQGTRGSRQECAEWVARHWTDRRPLSERKAAEERRQAEARAAEQRRRAEAQAHAADVQRDEAAVGLDHSFENYVVIQQGYGSFAEVRGLWREFEPTPPGWTETGERGDFLETMQRLIDWHAGRRMRHVSLVTTWTVIANDEEQYAIWPADPAPPLPRGWRDTGWRDEADRCLTHVEALWTEWLPLSERRARAARDEARRAEEEAKRRAWEALTEEQRRERQEAERRAEAARQEEIRRAAEEEARRRYRAMVNAAGQYAIFPADQPLPSGWSAAGFEGTQHECVDFIERASNERAEAAARRRAEEEQRREAEARREQAERAAKEQAERAAREQSESEVVEALMDEKVRQEVIAGIEKAVLEKVQRSLQDQEAARRAERQRLRAEARVFQADARGQPVPNRFGEQPQTDAYLGEIRLFAADFAPTGWAPCEGQLLRISEFTPLFAVLGVRFGGDGTSSFGLPDLRGNVPLHPSAGRDDMPKSVGESKPGMPVALDADPATAGHAPGAVGLRYMIAVKGLFPTRP